MRVVSRDIIKPSSPTRYHLKIYNLSLLDQIAVNGYIPVVAFYPTSSTYQITSHDLKNSLSQSLSEYYPYAGRLVKPFPTYVDCNDEGVEFIEAINDTPLMEFLQRSEHEDLDQLFPNDLIWFNQNFNGHDDHQMEKENNANSRPALCIQVNHFSCGGIAIAASLSHKVGDGSSLLNFMNHWATVTRSNDLPHMMMINPHFIPYQTRNVDLPKNLPDKPQGEYIARSFIFPNSKINDLKAKIISMTKESGDPIENPTRIEALTWLLHKCAVTAASKTNSGVFKSTGVGQIMNLRDKLVEQLPETSVGNIYLIMEVPTRNEIELTPNYIIGELRKRNKEFRGIRNLETALEMVEGMCCDHTAMFETTRRIAEDYYVYSVLNRFPTYGIDFGGGKPVKVSIAGALKNVIFMMDTPNMDGVDALVSLEKQHMKMIQNDPELLAFC